MFVVEVEQAVRAIASSRASADPEVLLLTSLPAAPEQCGVVRNLAVKVLNSWIEDSDTADAVLWILAELFTNGLEHHAVVNGERLCVSLTANVGPAGRWLAMSVTDSGPGSMRPRRKDQTAEDGRGLAIVRAFGAKITDEVFDAGYQVTAWLGGTSELRSQVCRCDCVAWGHQQDNICTWTVESAESRPDGDFAGLSVRELICKPCAKHVEGVTARLSGGHESAGLPSSAARETEPRSVLANVGGRESV